MLACVILPGDSAQLTRRLFAVSPLIERCGTLVFLDVSGTSRLHGGTAGLFAAIERALSPERPLGLSLASNRFTAEVAARHGRGPVAIAEGDEALYLSRLPLSALPWSAELERRLSPLGLETLGDFASLPSGSVERRYGRQGLALQRLARGQDAAALLPERDDQPLTVSRELEGGADGLSRLAPVLEQALGCLCDSLSERSLALSRLELSLLLDKSCADEEGSLAENDRQVEKTADRADQHAELGDDTAGRGADTMNALVDTLTFVVAPAAPETRVGLLLELLSSRLSAEPPPRPVLELTLRALQVAEPAVHQNQLFGEVARDASRRAEALSRLASVLGAEALAKPQVRPAHRVEDRSLCVVEEVTETSPGKTGRSRSQRASKARRAAKAQRATKARRATKAQRAAKVQGAARSRASDGESRDLASPLTVLRWLPCPQELVPIMTGGQLTGFRQGRRELPLLRLSPPRRLEGGWWALPWARDEFELQTPDGGIYRICRDMAARRWLLLAEID